MSWIWIGWIMIPGCMIHCLADGKNILFGGVVQKMNSYNYCVNNSLRFIVAERMCSTRDLEHELVHGYQFLKGEIDYNPNGLPGLTYYVFDEVCACKREWAFTGDTIMYYENQSMVLAHVYTFGYIVYSILPMFQKIFTPLLVVYCLHKLMPNNDISYFQTFPEHI